MIRRLYIKFEDRSNGSLVDNPSSLGYVYTELFVRTTYNITIFIPVPYVFGRCNHVTTKTSKQSDDNRLCRYLLTDICPHPLYLRGCPLCIRWWIRITLDLGRCFGHLFVFSTCRFQGKTLTLHVEKNK